MGIIKRLLDGHFGIKYAKVPVLFHGTNMAYVDKRIKEAGKYVHIKRDGFVKPVYLTQDSDSALDYALRRSRGRLEQPVVLIVCTQNVLYKLQRVFLQPVVDDLNFDEFDIHVIGDDSLEVEMKKIREAITKLNCT